MTSSPRDPHDDKADLAPDSIASVILDPQRTKDAPSPAMHNGALTPGSIASHVVAPITGARLGVIAAAFLGALALHGAAVASAWHANINAEKPHPPEATKPIQIEHVVDLTEPEPEPEPPPEPEAPPEPPPIEEAPPPPPTARPAPAVNPDPAPSPESPSATPPPPAQAGEVVTAQADDAPVDFTGFDVTTGEGAQFAGGVTASTGTNTEAVHTDVIDPNATPDQPQGEVDCTSPVQLSSNEWECSWPAEADSLGIDEQEVLIRAVVNTEGRALKVDILADPGHGFGEKALECAKQHHFEPAKDRRCHPYTSTSPPLNIHFER